MSVDPVEELPAQGLLQLDHAEVIALGPDGAEGVNMLPGGQSGIKESEYWSDQAALWLGNETWPMHTTVDSVIGAASHRETFAP